MSDVVWCDIGGHLMSANDPDRDFYPMPGNEHGQSQKTKRIDVCGKHKLNTIDMPDMGSIADRLKAIETAERRAELHDEAKRDAVTEYLEWRNDNPDAPIEKFYETQSVPPIAVT